MASLRIEIETTVGQKKIARLLRVVEPKTILTVVGGRFLSFVDESFRTKGRGQWPPLAPTTVALRKRGGSNPLQDSGDYKKSFIQETDGKTYVEVGTNLKLPSGHLLGKIHEMGTGPYTIRVKRARVLAAQARAGNWFFFGKQVQHPGIPARPVLPTKAVAERLVQQVLDGMLAVADKKEA